MTHNQQLTRWEPPPLPAHIDQPSQLTPQAFMGQLASLQQAMEANALAMADFQRHQQAAIELYQRPPAPAPYQPAHPPAPYYQPAHPQPWQPHWGPQPWGQWQPPAPAPQPTHTTISPVINIDSRSNSHSAQDNGGGSWFGLLLGLGFCFALGAAALGGN